MGQLHVVKGWGRNVGYGKLLSSGWQLLVPVGAPNLPQLGKKNISFSLTARSSNSFCCSADRWWLVKMWKPKCLWLFIHISRAKKGINVSCSMKPEPERWSNLQSWHCGPAKGKKGKGYGGGDTQTALLVVWSAGRTRQGGLCEHPTVKPQVLSENHYKSSSCAWPPSVASIHGLALRDGEPWFLACAAPCLLEIAKCSGLVGLS